MKKILALLSAGDLESLYWSSITSTSSKARRINDCVYRSFLECAMRSFQRDVTGQFERIFGLYNALQWPSDGQRSGSVLPGQVCCHFTDPGEKPGLGLDGKPETRTWNRVHPTEGASSDCATIIAQDIRSRMRRRGEEHRQSK